MPDLPPHIPTQPERRQSQPYNPYQPPIPISSGGQSTGAYPNYNPMSTSLTPMFNALSSSSTMPSTATSQTPMSNSFPGSAPMLSSMYPGYGNWANNMGVGGIGDHSMPMNTGLTYYPQQSQQSAPAGMSMVQPNQWPSGQNHELDAARFANLNCAMPMGNPPPTTQSEVKPTDHSISLPASGPPVTGSSAPMNGKSPTDQAKEQSKPRETPRTKPRDGYRVSKAGRRPAKQMPSQSPKLVWRAGMKEIRITDKMTEEQRENAMQWNDELAEAKREHVRTQNRESAQRSRARKAVELNNSKGSVKVLSEENDRLQEERQVLQNVKEQLLNRIAFLEQQIQLFVNSNPTVSTFADQAQSSNPAQDPTLGQNPGQTQNAPQAQGGYDNILNTINTSQLLANNAPDNPAQQASQPDGNMPALAEDPIDWTNINLDNLDSEAGQSNLSWSTSHCEGQ